ncbi:MAG: redoxin domain-containing protein [Anaerolineae bacterium]|nr:redoxin domain-containing protein [Anaerolineae bacterium]
MRLDWDRRATWYWTMAALAVLGVAWIAWSRAQVGAVEVSSAPQAAPQEGYPAPDFALHTTDGALVRLSDLRGKVVVVNFWATWCPPCRTEMPALQEVYLAHQERGLEVLAVNMQEGDPQAEAFVLANGLTFPVLTDPGGAVSARYRIASLPTTLFIDRQGLIRAIVIGGPLSHAYLESQVAELLSDGGSD